MKKRRYYKGRRISKGEKKIAQFFDSHNIDYTREKTFKNCLSLSGNCLRFDFYLEQFNILLEFQGQHHYGPINKYRKAKIVHETTVTHDAIKNKFTLDNKINLFEIKYKDYENIDEILINLFKEIENDLNCKILT